VEPNYWS